MILMKYIEIKKDAIDSIIVNPGQFIYCNDTGDFYLDADKNSRILITEEIMCLEKESDREDIFQPLLNQVYFVLESKKFYKYEGTWFTIKDLSNFLCIMLHDNQYRGSEVIRDGEKTAPVTLAECVYNEDTNMDLQEEIEASSKLTLTKTKFVYVEVVRDGQKSFKIPFPLENYDFRTNYMHVVIDSYLIEPHRYTIKDDEFLVLDNTVGNLQSGQLILFLFYYNVYVNLNDGVLLSTQNYRDLSVTESKLAAGAVSNRALSKHSVSLGKLTPDFKLPTEKLADGSVTTVKLADDAVTADKLSNNSVTSVKIADNAVNTSKIALQAITAPKMADDAITTNKIVDANVTAAKLAPGAVDSTKLADGSVTTAKLATNAVTEVKITDASVTNRKIANGAINVDKLSDNSVNTAKIVNGSITDVKIATNAVNNSKIIDDAISTNKIANEAVTDTKIAPGAVNNAKIVDNAISTNKIANEAVTHAKLGNGSVINSKLADNAVTTNKIANEAVTDTKIVNGAVNNAKITNNAVTGNKIAGGAIESGHINSNLRLPAGQVTENTSKKFATEHQLSKIDMISISKTEPTPTGVGHVWIGW